MLGQGFSGTKLVKYTDFKTKTVLTVTSISSSAPNWAGLHIMGRYQTEDNLYTGSWRVDGQCIIKKKFKGVYTDLGSANCGPIPTYQLI